LQLLASRMGNVLESVTEPLYPAIGGIKQCMLENGVLGALMSGSGPTVFGIFATRPAARSAFAAIRSAGLAKQVYLVTPYNIHRQQI
ncbi:MAG: 4-(cytidine 5'-diphospho)-2-C-methyl-D-erythritol kinase, partial [Lachnospiraceae bacterium]|nr:4-(cytidine 5'-diphospho)-2-C-methyl-D-erythritol kinase [Lachnospiraceae bacterium]